MTKTGVIFGTPDYMSPEQAEGKPADHRVDIYALGVILYELATGRLPFVAETFMGVLHQHMAKVPQPPRELAPDIAPEFEAIILRGLEKDPADRFQSMNELAEALKTCVDPPIAPGPSATPRDETPTVRTDLAGGAMAVPPMKPQSNISTGRVAALSDAPPVSPTSPSAVELTTSPVAAEAAGKKSMLPMILIIVVVTLALGAGAFFLMKRRGTRGDNPSTSPGGATAMTAPPPIKVDAAAVMEPEMRPEPTPIYVNPEQVTLSVKTTPRRVKAKVYLNGKLIGTTPLHKKAIPYSDLEKTLEIRAPRHKTVQIKFTPDANQSWERRLIRGRGTTRVVSMRPMHITRPMHVMHTGTAPPMTRVTPMPPPMPPPVRTMVPMDLKDPFAM